MLARGLNYAITPTKIPYEDFILATEIACKSNKGQGKKAELRKKIASILKTARLPPANMKKQEVQAAHALAKVKSIITLPADKRRAIVTMDTDHYEKQMDIMLEDSNI